MQSRCYHWTTVQNMTRHVETGAPLPREIFDRLISARQFMVATACMRQLGLAAGDLALHTAADADARPLELYRVRIYPSICTQLPSLRVPMQS